MALKEYKAKTIDEAITMATVDLGVTSGELYYEVIEKGSSGFLGIGKKDVTIAACPISEKEEVKEEPVVEPVLQIKPEVIEPAKEEKKEVKKAEIKEEKPAKPVKEISKEEVEKISNTAKAFLVEVFDAMNLKVDYNIVFSDRDNSLLIELSGDHMGIIIGKRGQTLDSLQYLVNLVVNKKSETYIRIKLDTEDYRRRRKETLENLAKNIAHKVKRSGKPVTLEAMNPYERRTIHYALQKDRFVTTYSEGDEPFRHVVVTVRKNEK